MHGQYKQLAGNSKKKNVEQVLNDDHVMVGVKKSFNKGGKTFVKDI
jgi:hypothetical protein